MTAKQVSDDTWAYYAPFLTAVGQPFFQDPPTVLLPRTGWQAQLVLTLPIYDGGQRSGITRDRNAQLVEARANLDSGLRQAQADVRVSFEEMLRADQGSARRATPLASRTRPMTWPRSPTAPGPAPTSRCSTLPARRATPTRRPPRRRICHARRASTCSSRPGASPNLRR